MLFVHDATNAQVAVVTGGASGIGLAIARRCVEQGCKVVVSDGNPRLLSEACAGIISLCNGAQESGGGPPSCQNGVCDMLDSCDGVGLTALGVHVADVAQVVADVRNSQEMAGLLQNTVVRSKVLNISTSHSFSP